MKYTITLLLFILFSCNFKNDNSIINPSYMEKNLIFDINQLKKKDSILRVQLKNTKNTFTHFSPTNELKFLTDKGELYVDKMIYMDSSKFLFTFYPNSLIGNTCLIVDKGKKVKSFILEGVPTDFVSKNYKNYELINVLCRQKGYPHADIIYSYTFFLSKINNNDAIISSGTSF